MTAVNHNKLLRPLRQTGPCVKMTLQNTFTQRRRLHPQAEAFEGSAFQDRVRHCSASTAVSFCSPNADNKRVLLYPTVEDTTWASFQAQNEAVTRRQIIIVLITKWVKLSPPSFVSEVCVLYVFPVCTFEQCVHAYVAERQPDDGRFVQVSSDGWLKRQEARKITEHVWLHTPSLPGGFTADRPAGVRGQDRKHWLMQTFISISKTLRGTFKLD